MGPRLTTRSHTKEPVLWVHRWEWRSGIARASCEGKGRGERTSGVGERHRVAGARRTLARVEEREEKMSAPFSIEFNLQGGWGKSGAKLRTRVRECVSKATRRPVSPRSRGAPVLHRSFGAEGVGSGGSGAEVSVGRLGLKNCTCSPHANWSAIDRDDLQRLLLSPNLLRQLFFVSFRVRRRSRRNDRKPR